jgi:uncharacterized protein (DUF1800 family)
VRQIIKTPSGRLALCLLLLIVPLTAGAKKPKKIKASANPPQYAAFSRPLSAQDQIRHALDRLTFGPRPGDAAQLEQTGLDGWLDAQLHPERIPENPILLQRLAPFDSLRMSIRQTFLHYPPPQMIAAVAHGKQPLPDDPELRAVVETLVQKYVQKKQLTNPYNDADPELKVKLSDVLSPDRIAVLTGGKPDQKRQVLESIPPGKRLDFVWALQPDQRRKLFALAPVELRRELMLSVNPQAVVTSDLTEGKLLRAIYSNHQLQELLVDFWYNHFNVFISKGADHYLVPSYEREAIRPHVFGKFQDLLLATAQSPAMLFYLDNWQSVSPDSRRPNAKNKRGLNENYGRELLELHTLGVDGGYTQKDVIEVARCFTGWTIAAPRKGGGFEYNDKVHDKGRKVVLGHVIKAGGGMNDGLEVLKILAHRPSTAHFISLKLAQRFVADDPPPSLVDRMAHTFLKKDGDLREVMRTMLSSPEFWSEGAYRVKIKTPFEMVVSAVRATNADVQSAFLLANQIQKLGEPLYRKVEPTGYSSANAEWVSSAGLLNRMNFGLALAHNRVPGVKIDTAAWQADPANVARAILDRDPSTQTQEAIQKALTTNNEGPSLIAGLVIGSPDFQKR